ncbi:MAG: response regulator [Chitinophagales bacterium]|nr:response regulator [Chitinophagales bacterium]
MIRREFALVAHFKCTMEKLKDKYVLIVDDDAPNTFALSSYLQSMDMKVRIAANGLEALKMLELHGRPEVILLDIVMPVMDGYKTMEALQQNLTLKTIPIIVVTAKALKGDKEKCLEAGAWDYLPKPIDVKILINKLNNWIV